MSNDLREIFAPITQQVNKGSRVTFNIGSSNLISGEVVQNVFIGNRQSVPAMNIQIIGLEEFISKNSYTLPIASSTVLGGVKIGSGISIAPDGTISTSSSGGTVTSVSVGNLSPLFTASVANPTTTPSITFAQVSQAQNLVFASPNGSSGVPTFRALVASDIPSLPYLSAVSGTTNRITVTGGSVIDIASAYAGQSSIATLGTITTGVWNGTLISPQYGGTGVNNSTRTITINSNNAAFTFGGAFTLTVPATGTATLGTGTSGQATFWTGTNTVSSDSAFLWDNTNKRLQVGTVSPIFTRDLNISKSVAGDVGFSLTNTSAAALADVQFILAQSTTQFVTVAWYNSGNTTFHTGTGGTIAIANTGQIQCGNLNDRLLILQGSPIVGVIGSTTTNNGFRFDSVGLRLGVNNALSTANVNTFTVNGSVSFPIVAKTANYTLTVTDNTVTFNGTSLTATLPAASTCTGRIYCIVNYNATALTISAYIDWLSASVTTVAANTAIRIQSDGTNWRLIP